jgi:competence protein ComGC
MVLLIIGVIAAIAVPGLRKAKQNAQSGSAIQSVRMITTAEQLYERKHKRFAVLSDLVPEASIDTNIGSGHKSGYTFVITLGPDATGAADRAFTCTAEPDDQPAERPFFFTDETAVIRFNEGSPADASSPPIPR